MFVFVLDTKKRPLAPTHPARARQLLKNGKAAVYRRYPFTIILKREVSEIDNQPLRLKIDPGSKTTGFAILNDKTGEVVWVAELQHRGQQIKKSLEKRRSIRRSRRNRKTRYRQPRFNNRTRPKGWLPPSLMSRVDNIRTWVTRLRNYCPITAISMELVRFDTQRMQNPEISGAELGGGFGRGAGERSHRMSSPSPPNPPPEIEYQQGTLFGYEVREYLLEKFGRKCAYCEYTDAYRLTGKENIPGLEVEHIIPKARNGSNRISNLTIACRKCNDKKGTQTAKEFGHPQVQVQAKKPLRDAAAINATRWETYRRIQATNLPIEIGTGGRTKYNRIKKNLPKTHWLDAVCVGASTPETIKVEGIQPRGRERDREFRLRRNSFSAFMGIVATGHGSRQICSLRSVVYFVNH